MCVSLCVLCRAVFITSTIPFFPFFFNVISVLFVFLLIVFSFVFVFFFLLYRLPLRVVRVGVFLSFYFSASRPSRPPLFFFFSAPRFIWAATISQHLLWLLRRLSRKQLIVAPFSSLVFVFVFLLRDCFLYYPSVFNCLSVFVLFVLSLYIYIFNRSTSYLFPCCLLV